MRNKKIFLLFLALQNATDYQLNSLIGRINKTIEKYTRGGNITDVAQLERELNKLIDSYYSIFVDKLLDNGQQIAIERVNEALIQIIPKLAKAGLYSEAINFYNDVKLYAESTKARMMFTKRGGQTLAVRIKTIQDGTEKTVRNIIANGVKDGKGSKAIAKDIAQYIKPVDDLTSIKPYDEYRKRFGRPKSFTPKGVPPGSVQYNSLRIARTESANVYRERAFDFYDDRQWVKGYRRVLSNRHPKTDECDTYAKKIYAKREDVPGFHIQCLCDVQAVVMTEQELTQLLTGGRDKVTGAKLNGQLGNPYRDARGRFTNETYATMKLGKPTPASNAKIAALDADDEKIMEILAKRPTNLRTIEQSVKQMSDKQRLALTANDTGQAGLQLEKSKRDELLAKFRRQASNIK